LTLAELRPRVNLAERQSMLMLTVIELKVLFTVRRLPQMEAIDLFGTAKRNRWDDETGGLPFPSPGTR